MSATSKQTPEHQQLIADTLNHLLTMSPGELFHVRSVPYKLVKNIGVAIRDRNNRGAYDDPLYGKQWNVNVSQSDNGDGTMLLTFRKVENEAH